MFSKFKSHKYLITILVIGFLLRFIGIWYGLPSLFNSDEPFNLVNALSYGAKKSLEPTYFVYPSFYSYALFAVSGLYFVFGKVTGIFESALDFGASYFLNPTGLFFTGRLFSVFLGAAALWMLFKLGQKYFSKRIAIFSSLVLALSFTHTDLSHWILLEPAVTLLSTLSLFLVFRYAKTPILKWNLLTGLVCGLAISTKYNAGFIILPFVISVVLTYKKQFSKMCQQLGLSAFALLFGFLIGSPYWLFSFSKFWNELNYTFSHVNAGMVGHISSLPFVWPLWDLIYHDWTIGILLVAGCIYALFQREKKQNLLMSFALPTLIIVGLWQRTGVHYLAPILPALALLAGVFFNDILEQLPKKTYRLVLLLVFFIPPLLKIAYQDYRLTQKDTRSFAKEWIESNIPEGSMICYENYVYGPNLFDPMRYLKNPSEGALLPVELKERLLKEKRLRISYQLINLRKDFKLRILNQPATDSSSVNNRYFRQLLEMRLPKLSAVKNAGIKYIMVSSDNYDRYFKGTAPKRGTAVWLSYQNGKKFYSGVFESEDLVLLQEFQRGKWNLGPTIKIYKFKS